MQDLHVFKTWQLMPSSCRCYCVQYYIRVYYHRQWTFSVQYKGTVTTDTVPATHKVYHINKLLTVTCVSYLWWQSLLKIVIVIHHLLGCWQQKRFFLQLFGFSVRSSSHNHMPASHTLGPAGFVNICQGKVCFSRWGQLIHDVGLSWTFLFCNIKG